MRQTRQALVNDQRASVSNELTRRAFQYALPREEVSCVSPSEDGHDWKFEVCLGKGRFFDDIGRWFKKVCNYYPNHSSYKSPNIQFQCTAADHSGHHCTNNIVYITDSLPDAQLLELKGLWATYDSIENWAGGTKMYRKSKPPASLLAEAAVSAPTTIASLQAYLLNESETQLRSTKRSHSFSSVPTVSSRKRPHNSSQSGLVGFDAERNETAADDMVLQSTLYSDDEDFPPVHLAFKEALAAPSKVGKAKPSAKKTAGSSHNRTYVRT